MEAAIAFLSVAQGGRPNRSVLAYRAEYTDAVKANQATRTAGFSTTRRGPKRCGRQRGVHAAIASAYAMKGRPSKAWRPDAGLPLRIFSRR